MATPWVLMIAAVISVTHAQLNWTVTPVNTAARIKDEVELYCQGDFDSYGWTRTEKYNDTTSETIERLLFFKNGSAEEDIPENLTQLYARNDSRPSDLIVKVANAETATYYTCDAGKGGVTESVQVSINALGKPKCDIFMPSLRPYSKYYTPDLTCSVSYYGPLKPRLTWWLMGAEQEGQVVVKDTGIPEIGQRGRLVLQLNTTIDSSVHKLPFECRLSFNPDDQIHRKILAMPTYEDNCYVTIESACIAQNIRFTPDPDDIKDGGNFTLETGSHLVCRATGCGTLHYGWVSVETNVSHSTTQALLITDEMIGKENVYTCIVQNEFGEAGRNVSFYAVNTTSSTSSTSPLTSTQVTSSEPDTSSTTNASPTATSAAVEASTSTDSSTTDSCPCKDTSLCGNGTACECIEGRRDDICIKPSARPAKQGKDNSTTVAIAVTVVLLLILLAVAAGVLLYKKGFIGSNGYGSRESNIVGFSALKELE